MSHGTHASVGQPSDHHDETLYWRDGVRVTQRWLTVDDQRYQIKELRNLRTVRGDRRPLGSHALVPAAGLTIVFVAGAQWLSADVWLSVAGGLVVALAVLTIGMVTRPYACELWADYRGLTVQLLWLDDRERFNQICRALTRAKERSGR